MFEIEVISATYQSDRRDNRDTVYMPPSLIYLIPPDSFVMVVKRQF